MVIIHDLIFIMHVRQMLPSWCILQDCCNSAFLFKGFIILSGYNFKRVRRGQPYFTIKYFLNSNSSFPRYLPDHWPQIHVVWSLWALKNCALKMLACSPYGSTDCGLARLRARSMNWLGWGPRVKTLWLCIGPVSNWIILLLYYIYWSV